MAEFISTISPFMILGDLEELVVSSSAPSVRVEVANNGKTFFSEDFLTNGGRVTIHNFKDIVAPLVSSLTIAQIQIKASDSNGTATKAPYVLFCSLSLPSSFVDAHFLSVAQEERETFPDADETLYFTSSTATEANAYCTVIASLSYVRDNANEVFTEDVEIGNLYCLNTVARVDVSPRRFIREGCTLISYGIYADHRQMFYRVSEHSSPFPVFFRNAFGLFETAYFWGAVKTSITGDRASAWINGQKRNYKIDTAYEWEADSGLVNAGAVALMSDMARSRDVLIAPMDFQLNVLVSDLKLEADNDNSSLNSCKVTLVQAQKNQPLFSGVSDLTRIFDITFDMSFN